MPSVRDNAALARFELDVEGGTAFASYRRLPGTVIITHTETPRAARARTDRRLQVRDGLQAPPSS
jgi:hypothetical protein